MDLNYLRQITKTQLENAKKKNKIVHINQTYHDQKQETEFSNIEWLQPLINVQEQIKKTIDEKQDRLIAKLTDNQNELTDNQMELTDTLNNIYILIIWRIYVRILQLPHNL